MKVASSFIALSATLLSAVSAGYAPLAVFAKRGDVTNTTVAASYNLTDSLNHNHTTNGTVPTNTKIISVSTLYIENHIEICFVKEGCNVCDGKDMTTFTSTKTISQPNQMSHAPMSKPLSYPGIPMSVPRSEATATLLATDQKPQVWNYPTGIPPGSSQVVAQRSLVAITQYIPSATVWSNTLVVKGKTRTIYKTITKATNIVYYQYERQVVTEHGVAATYTTKSVTTSVSSSLMPTSAYCPTPTTIKDGNITLTITVVPTTVTYTLTKAVTVTSTVDVTKTSTITSTASASLLPASSAWSHWTSIKSVPQTIAGTKTWSRVTETIPVVYVTDEVITITVPGLGPTAGSCHCTCTATPSIIIEEDITITIAVVTKIFEFWYKLDGTSTVTTCTTVTETTCPPTTSMTLAPTLTSTKTITWTSGGHTYTSTKVITVTAPQSSPIKPYSALPTTKPTGGFCVGGNIKGGQYGMCVDVVTKVIIFKVVTDLLPPPSIGGHHSGDEINGKYVPLQCNVNEQGLLITETLDVVYINSAANPCEVSYGSVSDTLVLNFIETLKIIWETKADGSLACYRSGVELIFMVCEDLKLYCADSWDAFDLSICFEVILIQQPVPVHTKTKTRTNTVTAVQSRPYSRPVSTTGTGIVAPVSTTTGVVIPMSTTSTVVVPLSTTSSIVAPLSTTSSVVVPLSTTSSIVAPLSMTSSVVAPLSTTSSIVAPLSTTSSVIVPLSTTSSVEIPVSTATSSSVEIPLSTASSSSVEVPLSTVSSSTVEVPATTSSSTTIEIPLSTMTESTTVTTESTTVTTESATETATSSSTTTDPPTPSSSTTTLPQILSVPLSTTMVAPLMRYRYHY